MDDAQPLSTQIALGALEWVESAEGDFLNHPNVDAWQAVHSNLPGIPMDTGPLVDAVLAGDRDRIAQVIGELVSTVASAGAQAAALVLVGCHTYVDTTCGPEQAAAMFDAVRVALVE